jgi:hypothetical protein
MTSDLVLTLLATSFLFPPLSYISFCLSFLSFTSTSPQHTLWISHCQHFIFSPIHSAPENVVQRTSASLLCFLWILSTIYSLTHILLLQIMVPSYGPNTLPRANTDGVWVGYSIYRPLTHSLLLQVIRAPAQISALYKSLQHMISLLRLPSLAVSW